MYIIISKPELRGPMAALHSSDLPSREQPVSQLQPRPLAWLWPSRLALGKLALIDGDPELGKSLVTLDLCARLSTGRPWPDDEPGSQPAMAIVLNGEDAGGDTVRPRLQVLAADLDRIFVLPPHGPDRHSPLALPHRTDALEAALARTHARLVVIDPITAFLEPGVNLASDPGIRRALAPLAALAERYDCTVLLVRHLNKTGRARALYRGLGSIGLTAVCRSAWLVALDPHYPGRRVLAQLKNNLAPPQPSLAFEVRPTEGGLPVLAWLGKTDLGADALLADVHRPERPRDTARQFLLEMLHDGPRTARDLWQRAVIEGLNRRTLQRARTDLDIRSVRVHEEGKTICYWLLPGQQLPREVHSDSAVPDLEPWLAPLRERFPPSTPLDDL